MYCYIARVNTKRDWLICGYVLQINAMYPAGQQLKNCCPPRPATYINKQNSGTTSITIETLFVFK